MILRLFIFFIIIFFTDVVATLSQPVFIQSGRHISQGYMYNIDNKCYVLTARHSVNHFRKSKIFAFDKNAARYRLEKFIDDKDIDIAVLIGKNHRLGCKVFGSKSHGKVRFSDLEEYKSRFNRQKPLYIERVSSETDAIEWNNVEFEYSDKENGFFYIKPGRYAPHIMQSFSGAMVTRGRDPYYKDSSINSIAGIVTRVEPENSGVAMVVHIDRIESFLFNYLSPIAKHFRISPSKFFIYKVLRDLPNSNLRGPSRTNVLTVTLQAQEKLETISEIRVRCGINFRSNKRPCVSSMSISISKNPASSTKTWSRLRRDTNGPVYTFYNKRIVRSIRLNIIGNPSLIKGFQIVQL